MSPPIAGLRGRGIDEVVVGERLAGHRRQHRALPAALAQPPRHARGADHPGGIDARHQARALRRARELALLERGCRRP